MKTVWLAGMGCLGPGLPDWRSTREVLLGNTTYADGPDPNPVPALLPANERRRASVPARWALTVGSEALAGSGFEPEKVATVFTSCAGDSTVTHQLCSGLAVQPPEISPTRFHNSVHNAPAGYWSIFARSRAPSSTLCGFDASFAAGLLEAALQAAVEKIPVLLVAYDLPAPDPLRALWPVARPFAAALLLSPTPPESADRAALRLAIGLADGPARSGWPAMLPADLSTNPAAQAIEILAVVAQGGGRAELQYLRNSHLAVEINS